MLSVYSDPRQCNSVHALVKTLGGNNTNGTGVRMIVLAVCSRLHVDLGECRLTDHGTAAVPS